MQDLKINKVDKENLEDFYAFFSYGIENLFPEYNAHEKEYILNKGWTKDKYLNGIIKGSKVLLTVSIDGKIVGLMDTDTPFMGVALGVWLMVDKKHQGKGIGTSLIKKFEEISKERGAHSVYLYSGKNKAPFYKKKGYELVGIHKKAWFGQDHCYFTKQIAEPKEENYLK